MLFVWFTSDGNCVHLYPYQTIADFFKTTTNGFFYLLKILYIANIVFLFLKIYSVLWNKQKPVQNHLLSKLAFYDHLVFTKKQKNAETASNKTLYMLKIELDSLDNLKK